MVGGMNQGLSCAWSCLGWRVSFCVQIVDTYLTAQAIYSFLRTFWKWVSLKELVRFVKVVEWTRTKVWKTFSYPSSISRLCRSVSGYWRHRQFVISLIRDLTTGLLIFNKRTSFGNSLGFLYHFSIFISEIFCSFSLLFPSIFLVWVSFTLTDT